MEKLACLLNLGPSYKRQLYYTKDSIALCEILPTFLTTMKKCRHDNIIENKHKHKLFPRFLQNDKLLSFLGFENKNS